jgi:hypothetical protein
MQLMTPAQAILVAPSICGLQGGACAASWREKSVYVIIQLLKRLKLQCRNAYAGSYVLDGPWSAAHHGKTGKTTPIVGHLTKQRLRQTGS